MAESPPIARTPAPKSLAGVLAPWLAAQLAVLALAAFQTPLSDKFVRPAERLALEEMIVAQILAAGLFAPTLFRNLTTALSVMATAWPLAALAGVLGACGISAIARAELGVMLWMAVLWAWTWAVSPKGDLGNLLVSASATLLSLGGAVLAYLKVEFGPSQGAWENVGFAGPAVGILRLMKTGELARWLPVIYLSAIAVLMAPSAGLLIRRLSRPTSPK